MTDPHLDLKLKAVIDWVEVRIKLRGLTQFRHVQSRLESSAAWGGKAPHVHEERVGGRSLVTFRVQDPACPADLLRRVQAAACPGTPAIVDDDIEIVAVELALDLYSAVPDREALVDAALHLYRHHARPPEEPAGGFPRLCRPARRIAAADIREVRAALAEGATINAGSPDAAYHARYYVKAHDTIGGVHYALLPSSQHRARMEITLSGTELPFASMATWRAFRFETLAGRFSLRLPVSPTVRPSLLTLAKLLQARAVRFGVPANAARAATHKRTTRAWTRTDGTWAERARDALRALTRAHQRPARARQLSGIRAGSDRPSSLAP